MCVIERALVQVLEEPFDGIFGLGQRTVVDMCGQVVGSIGVVHVRAGS
jgi:hypothetical protein